jgi:hypothetical protein
MLFHVYLSSGAYTIDAADVEDAAWQALTLSKDTNDFLIDIEPINYGQKEVLSQQLGSNPRSTSRDLQVY